MSGFVITIFVQTLVCSYVKQTFVQQTVLFAMHGIVSLFVCLCHPGNECVTSPGHLVA